MPRKLAYRPRRKVVIWEHKHEYEIKCECPCKSSMFVDKEYRFGLGVRIEQEGKEGQSDFIIPEELGKQIVKVLQRECNQEMK